MAWVVFNTLAGSPPQCNISISYSVRCFKRWASSSLPSFSKTANCSSTLLEFSATQLPWSSLVTKWVAGNAKWSTSPNTWPVKASTSRYDDQFPITEKLYSSKACSSREAGKISTTSPTEHEILSPVGNQYHCVQTEYRPSHPKFITRNLKAWTWISTTLSAYSLGGTQNHRYKRLKPQRWHISCGPEVAEVAEWRSLSISSLTELSFSI